MKLRKATFTDIDDVMQIFSQARLAQRIAGFRQWEDGYPSIALLESDIHNSIGFVLVDEDKVVGYVAITTYDEEYNRHPELWNIEKSYVAFHRIALADDYRGKGMSGRLFDFAESESRQIGADFVRIDTGIENKPMQHILGKRHYRYIGECDFIWGKRLVYEKSIVLG